LRDEALYPDAAMALLAIRDGAAEQFRAALPDVTGPQRVAVIQALGTLRDGESAGPLRRAAERDPDPVARLEAVWALANIGDSAAAGIVMKAADEARGFERVRATKACLLLAERLAAGGRRQDAEKIYRHLRDTRTDPAEQYVRDVAERAIAG
jgi:HEAT repeat protein